MDNLESFGGKDQKMEHIRINSNGLMNALVIMLVCSFFICDLVPRGSAIIAGITTIILIANVVLKRGKIRMIPCALFRYMLMFAFYSGLSALWAVDMSYSMQQCITIIELTFCIYIIYMHYSQYDSMLDLCKVLLYSAIFISAYSIFVSGINTIVTKILSGSRLLLVFTSINMVALLDTYAIVIVLYFATFYKRKAYLFTVPILLLIIIASETRKGIIALAIGILLIMFFRNRTKSIVKNLITAVTIVLFAFIVYRILSSIALFQPIMYRIEIAINAFTGEGYVDNSTRQRAEMIRIGIEQFKRTPLLGMGMGNPRLLVLGLWGKKYPYLHNNYAEILAGGGIVGLVLYYAMYFHLLIESIKYRKVEGSIKYVIWIMIAIIITMDYMMVSYYSKITYFYLVILYIGVGEMERKKKIEEKGTYSQI